MSETETVAPDVAPAIDVRALLAGAPARTPYTLDAASARPFSGGTLARGQHASQTDVEGHPLPVLVYEPRAARAQVIPLNVVYAAIASGLIGAAEITALQLAGPEAF